jgi:hypothetical protein
MTVIFYCSFRNFYETMEVEYRILFKKNDKFFIINLIILRNFQGIV